MEKYPAGRAGAYSEDASSARDFGYSADEKAASPKAATAAHGQERAKGDTDSAAAANIPEPETERKRIYSGDAGIRTENLEDKKKEIMKTAEESGGYVESVYERRISVSVPAVQFREIFDRILTMGDIIYKSIETYDVTEAYSDLDSRLNIARQSRDRLAALLEKTDDVKERIRILKEIRRLEEEIERLRSTLTILDSRIAYSRISIELVPRTTDTGYYKRNIPFAWIASLNPLSGSLTEMKGRAVIEPGDVFAVFEKEKFYRAEAPDGTRIRIGSIENKPEGTPEFWQKALAFHLKPYYRTVETVQYGKTAGVLFTSKDAKPFTYFVGTQVLGKTLFITEAFFPNPGAKETHLSIITDAFENLEIRK